MQWYVYLITVAALGFLWKIAAELVSEPISHAFCLRRQTLTQMALFRNIALPRPRELAITSQEIRQYDQAVENLRNAQQAFAELGSRFLALSESHPAIQALTVTLGLDMTQVGHALVDLAHAYASARIDKGEVRHRINKALQATDTALKITRRSRDALTGIRLEPIYLHNTVPQRR
jgi:hypothetical protein